MEKIRIITDKKEISGKSALPMPNLGSIVSQEISEININTLKNNIESALETMIDAFSKVDLNKSKAYLDCVKFNMSIDAKGEVALISVIKAGISTSTGIEFTIKFER